MQRFGLLGKSLKHSYSPMIHAEFGDYEYKLYEKAPEELDEFFAISDFDGLNVTIPYKKTVLKYCDDLSDTAKIAGCVNTIIKKDDNRLYGDNTDGFGFLYLLNKTKIDVTKGKILVLGSGGSSQTVQTVLKNEKAKEIVIISRSGADNYSNINKHNDAILIVNTTPVGMYPDNGDTPIEDLSIFKNCRAVIDLIYNPAITELMLQAEKLDIPSYNGLSMLVAQAKRSAELFTRSNIPDDAIEKVSKHIENQTQNIILIGMPGCGKTTTGKELAKNLGRTFADIDEIITERTGKTPADIITKDGEKLFRIIETDILAETCKKSSRIIATGGGVVTKSQNKDIMRQNGILVYLERNLNELPTSDRPLSQQKGLKALAAERIPLYENWCDLKIKQGDTLTTPALCATPPKRGI